MNEDYCCHRVLPHELIHLCSMEVYPVPYEMPYVEDLNYTAFNEGFAHAWTYPENIYDFVFEGFLREKFEMAKKTLRVVLAETDKQKQKRNAAFAVKRTLFERSQKAFSFSLDMISVMLSNQLPRLRWLPGRLSCQ